MYFGSNSLSASTSSGGPARKLVSQTSPTHPATVPVTFFPLVFNLVVEIGIQCEHCRQRIEGEELPHKRSASSLSTKPAASIPLSWAGIDSSNVGTAYSTELHQPGAKRKNELRRKPRGLMKSAPLKQKILRLCSGLRPTDNVETQLAFNPLVSTEKENAPTSGAFPFLGVRIC